MISKKTKAITAGILTAAMSATAVLPSLGASAAENTFATENGANESYAKMFESLYADVITNGEDNGYLSSNKNGDSFGIPYHSVETLCVEAPDYGHETTSEAMSYIAWICAMHDVLADQGLITSSGKDLTKAWNTVEALIPGWSKESYEGEDKVVSGNKYKTFWTIAKRDPGGPRGIKADALGEKHTPDQYPSQDAGGDAYNPIAEDFANAYGSDNGYYLLHWLADVDDWYGFGGGNGQFTFINTFQRGEQESCFETVPQPCLEELKYGMATPAGKDDGNGIKAIFNGENAVPKQYAFTNAPDAEDRAIQAIFFANQWGSGNATLSANAGKMGDQCRNDMFDKFYRKIGVGDPSSDNYDSKGISSPSASKALSQHYLMAWYTSWGGQLTASWGEFDWAWQIGCSHSHQFYQNPLAAYALVYDSAIHGGMKATSATEDYKKSLKRQIEMYLWLQSANGPFAGGCSNNYIDASNNNYSKYPDGSSTFYDMIYVEHPVYADPGSNHWIGNQVWSLQRLAELYYYVKTNNSKIAVTGDKSDGELTYGGLSLEEALEKLVGKQIDWWLENIKFDYTAEDGTEMAYAIPSSLDWSGQPATWTGTYNENANSGLTCVITGYGQGDIGCVSSICNTLIYYAAANGASIDAANGKVAPSTTADKALYTANKLMSAQWNTARDEIGIAYDDHNPSLKRIFEEEVYIPSFYSGTMPDGSPLNGSGKNTFSSIRKSYEDDEMYQDCKAVYEKTGETDEYYYKLHRFWHMGDALMTTGTMALLFPEVKPLNDEEPTSENDLKVTLWGDANVDGKVNMADAVAVLQNLANSEKYPISDQGAVNADVVDNGGSLTGLDGIAIQKLDAGSITQADCPVTADTLDSFK